MRQPPRVVAVGLVGRDRLEGLIRLPAFYADRREAELAQAMEQDRRHASSLEDGRVSGLRWNTATAADRDLFFRRRSEPASTKTPISFSLCERHCAFLLIADDVGAGKTVEAGLILRELLLRRRVDFALVSAPAGMVRQWQDELEAKFGLTFTIIDREYLNVLRRERGYGAGPWAAGS